MRIVVAVRQGYDGRQAAADGAQLAESLFGFRRPPITEKSFKPRWPPKGE